MPYRIELIDVDRKHALYSELIRRPLFTRKAEVYGCCIKLITDNKLFTDVWSDNFYSANENTRSHGRIIAIEDPGEPQHVKYDPLTKTAFIYNIDYYGWIKSVALAIAGDILEDAHEIHSIHGAALDLNGTGVALIAPSGVGKTTHSWGMLRNQGVRLLADDWFFVRLYERSALAFGSEKNCYVDADLGNIWDVYKGMLAKAIFDKRGRAVVNARWVIGNEGVLPLTTLRKVVLLKRDPDDGAILREISADEALNLLRLNSFYNPHQLVTDERKLKLRTAFFEKLLRMDKVFLANTAHPPMIVQDSIYRAVSEA
uniref:Aldolase n=1 Tax=Candidatus Methanomethylicus mesodigestus TaxID=1867258 RepID=A0A7C3IXC9_9CREN